MNKKLPPCDLCGKPANTVHFVPWVDRVGEVVFACRRHDAQGYWTELTRLDSGPPDWRNPSRKYTMRDHIATKEGGAYALKRLDERLAGDQLDYIVPIYWGDAGGEGIVTWLPPEWSPDG